MNASRVNGTDRFAYGKVFASNNDTLFPVLRAKIAFHFDVITLPHAASKATEEGARANDAMPVDTRGPLVRGKIPDTGDSGQQ
jgi:hypothetical protein